MAFGIGRQHSQNIYRCVNCPLCAGKPLWLFMVFMDTVNAQGCTRALKIKTFNFFQLIFCFYL